VAVTIDLPRSVRALAKTMTGNQDPSLSVRDIVRAGVGYLADLVSRIVNGIAGLVPVVVIGCSGPKVEKIEEKPAAVEPARTVESDEPTPLGHFDITFYYVIGEDEVAKKVAAKKAANDNAATVTEGAELTAIAPVQMVTIYEGKSCAPIAEVTKEFAAQLTLQGTGKLRDGRVVNIFGACACDRTPCFKVTETKWGTAGTGKPLQPFRTVAVDRNVIKLGSLLYVPMLEGRTMPGRAPWGGFVHDGCVVADDTGGGITGNQLDLFVGRKAYFHGLSGSGGSHSWARHIPVYDGSKVCERKGRKVARKAGSI
jgi:3D (Asp-Asp-Asp) domain-containing protein